MKIDYEETKIFVRPGSTDLRKGTSGLLAIIENEMSLNALDNSIFIFCNKNHKLIKLIFWDKTGFWLTQKRLEKSTWPWPKTNEKAKEINTEQIFQLLLLDILECHTLYKT